MNWRAWLAFAALGIIWGVPYFFIKLALLGLSPIALAWGRLVLATLIVLPIAWQRGALRALSAHKAAICAFALAEFVIPFSARCATAPRPATRSASTDPRHARAS